jgi:hypothetical protein
MILLQTGRLPYSELQAEQIIFRVGLCQAPDLTLLKPDASKSLRKLMLHCWARSPEERPGFATVLVNTASIHQRLQFALRRTQSIPNSTRKRSRSTPSIADLVPLPLQIS